MIFLKEMDSFPSSIGIIIASAMEILGSRNLKPISNPPVAHVLVKGFLFCFALQETVIFLSKGWHLMWLMLPTSCATRVETPIHGRSRHLFWPCYSSFLKTKHRGSHLGCFWFRNETLYYLVTSPYKVTVKIASFFFCKCTLPSFLWTFRVFQSNNSSGGILNGEVTWCWWLLLGNSHKQQFSLEICSQTSEKHITF